MMKSTRTVTVTAQSRTTKQFQRPVRGVTAGAVEHSKERTVSYRFEWKTADCTACPLRELCIKANHPHRTLVVGEHHTVLQERRQEQKTEDFKKKMRLRNAIEGTRSELVRAHGLRHARSRGLAKARLQNYFSAAACNIKHWLRRLAWQLQQDNIGAAASIRARQRLKPGAGSRF
jgi:hypothetical protein